MSFLSAYNEVYRVPVGDPERGYWVDLKKYVTQGGQEEAEACLAKVSVGSDGQPVAQPDVARYRKLMVKASIADWNLDEEDGRIWPINVQNVGRLPAPVFNELWEHVNNNNASRTKEEQLSFRVGGERSDQAGDSA